MIPSVEPRSSRPITGVSGRSARYCATAALMWPLASIITPTIHSDTEAMKPALACVTRMPCALAAATSTLRMSTAQRQYATRRGSRASRSAPPSVRRSPTMMSQPRAAPASASTVHSASLGLRFTLATASSAASARVP
jgi:hypothetical protein